MGGALGPAAQARPKKPKAPPVPPPLASAAELTLEQLNAWVAELAPQVEAAGGARFERVPHARFGTPMEMERILHEESLMVLSRLVDGPPHAVERIARESGGSPLGIVGKYGIATKVLYLSTDAVDGMVGSGGLEPSDVEVVAKLVLAHELAHALQDQVAGMEASFRGVADQDALNALRALTEGQANQVERDIARTNGWTRVQEALDGKQGWDHEGPKRAGAWDSWAAYGAGRDFVDRLIAEGGHERVWAAMKAPPQTTAPVFRAEASFERVVLPETWAATVRESDQALTAGPWTRVPSYVGEWALREEAFTYPDETLSLVLPHYLGGHGLKATRDDRAADVVLLRFDAPHWATAWIDLARASAERSGEDQSGLGMGVRLSVWEGVACDLGLERVVSMGDLVAMEHRTVWCARGDTVLQVSVKGFRPGNRMSTAVAGVWAGIAPTP